MLVVLTPRTVREVDKRLHHSVWPHEFDEPVAVWRWLVVVLQGALTEPKQGPVVCKGQPEWPLLLVVVAVRVAVLSQFEEPWKLRPSEVLVAVLLGRLVTVLLVVVLVVKRRCVKGFEPHKKQLVKEWRPLK